MNKKREIIFGFLLLFFGLCFGDKTGAVSKAERENNFPYSMILSEDTPVFLADPTIYYDPDTDLYYLYGTNGPGSNKKGFKVYTSANLKDWEAHQNYALSEEDVYGTSGFWAPQVFKYEGVYYMAYTANTQIAIAQSDDPLGPFTQKNKKPISDPEGVGNIDPFVFLDDDGTLYLYYVRFEEGNKLFVAELNKEITDVVPSTITPVLSTDVNPQSWEKVHTEASIAEGPTAIRHKGLYYLLYSANPFDNVNYAVGYATSEQVKGPWRKYDGNPILYRDLIGKNGPGHGDVFMGKDGHYYYVFHTHFSDSKVSPRRTGIVKMKFVSGKNGADIIKFEEDSFSYLTVKKSE